MSHGYFVYAVTVDDMIRYIGKGTGYRPYSHLSKVDEIVQARRPSKSDYRLLSYFYRCLAKAKEAGSEIKVTILQDNLTNKYALEKEAELIEQFKDQIWNKEGLGKQSVKSKRKALRDRHFWKAGYENLLSPKNLTNPRKLGMIFALLNYFRARRDKRLFKDCLQLLPSHLRLQYFSESDQHRISKLFGKTQTIQPRDLGPAACRHPLMRIAGSNGRHFTNRTQRLAGSDTVCAAPQVTEHVISGSSFPSRQIPAQS